MIKKKKDVSINDWIPNIELYAGHSPIFIVNNERYDFTEKLYDIGEFKKEEHYNIRKEFSLDLLQLNEKDLLELEKIKQHIANEVSLLPVIKNPVPASWKKVRNRIKKLREQSHFLSFNEFCDKVNDILPNRQDVKDVCVQFHKRGFLFWYENTMSDKVFINPQWAIDAINKVIKDQGINQKNGLFTVQDITNILKDDPAYENMSTTILQLMKAFHLAFPKDGHSDNIFIIPSRRLIKQPKHILNWNPEEKLIISYKYPYLPKGMVNQLTCLLHDKLVEDGVWSSGFMIEHKNAKALIKEKINELEITIEGKNRQPILSILEENIEKTHKLYKGIREGKRHIVNIQCPCQSCLESAKPTFFDKNKLENWFYENPDRSIMCNESQESYLIKTFFQEVGVEIPQTRVKIDEYAKPNLHFEKPINENDVTVSGSSEAVAKLLNPSPDKTLEHHPAPTSHASKPVTSTSTPITAWYKQWWVDRIVGGLLGGIVIAAIINTFVGWPFYDSYLISFPGLTAFLLFLGNPKRRFFKAAMMSLFAGISGLIFQITGEIVINQTQENGNARLMLQKLDDWDWLITLALLGVAVFLFYIDYKRDKVER